MIIIVVLVFCSVGFFCVEGEESRERRTDMSKESQDKKKKKTRGGLRRAPLRLLLSARLVPSGPDLFSSQMLLLMARSSSSPPHLHPNLHEEDEGGRGSLTERIDVKAKAPDLRLCSCFVSLDLSLSVCPRFEIFYFAQLDPYLAARPPPLPSAEFLSKSAASWTLLFFSSSFSF